MSIFNLSEGTVFPDLNKKEGKDAEHERDLLQLTTLKYKHFRKALTYPEQDQMHHLMIAMTNLSEDDLGELSPKDAAGISAMIFQAMKEYMKLGKQIVEGMQ
jgi:hypothetical protein